MIAEQVARILSKLVVSLFVGLVPAYITFVIYLTEKHSIGSTKPDDME